ncbi:hypothetical protein RA280_18430 [Cupriavidus sp. CV2]|uniref:hypothetical protein n=1 Tax=Cupriavidus ulmosensis TaxID=3065913 RepID=UPI00296ACC07|nr:hypothetical protein [Cupriavidus sp. CV2]MDW3683692.1 hypothetical protein [Cupriavidus sp. CV2]
MELNHADLEALREHQLVNLEETASWRRACITPKGGAVLEAIARIPAGLMPRSIWFPSLAGQAQQSYPVSEINTAIANFDS